MRERAMKTLFGRTKEQQARFREWATKCPSGELGVKFSFSFVTSANNATEIMVTCLTSGEKKRLGSMDEKMMMKTFGVDSSVEEIFLKVINQFPSASYTITFSPSGLGIASTFTIDFTNYQTW